MIRWADKSDCPCTFFERNGLTFFFFFSWFIFKQDTQWLLGNLLEILNKVRSHLLEWKPHGCAPIKFPCLDPYTGTYFYASETLVKLKLSVPSILRGKYFLRRCSMPEQNLSDLNIWICYGGVLLLVCLFCRAVTSQVEPVKLTEFSQFGDVTSSNEWNQLCNPLQFRGLYLSYSAA